VTKSEAGKEKGDNRVGRAAVRIQQKEEGGEEGEDKTEKMHEVRRATVEHRTEGQKTDQREEKKKQTEVRARDRFRALGRLRLEGPREGDQRKKGGRGKRLRGGARENSRKKHIRAAKPR